MSRRFFISMLVSCLVAQAVIVDRIAVIVDRAVIKNSDIDRALRITSFLNHEQPDFSPASRKATASRLVDQELIREQIRTGDYPVASEQEEASLLAKTKAERFANDAQYKGALARYGITEEELKDALLWQLTVLRFIDERFRPAAVVTDEQVETYYNAHRAALEAANPKAHSVDDLRMKIEDELAGEQVNQLFEEWLSEIRKDARIEYREPELQ
jgi:parvulin-like peptidyl-prolyl isomerase